MEVYRQLEMVVVSLDRLGSTYPADPERLRDATDAFITNWQVTQRLSYARRLLSEALDEGLSENESHELDDLLQMPHWTPSQPEPPPELPTPPRS
jgi:hypothetical protein